MWSSCAVAPVCDMLAGVVKKPWFYKRTHAWDTVEIDECKNPAMYVRREKASYKMSRSRSRSEKYKHWTLDGVTDQLEVLPFMFIGLLVRLVAVPKVPR